MISYLKVLEDNDLSHKSKLILIYICEKYLNKWTNAEVEINFAESAEALNMSYSEFCFFYEKLEEKYLNMRQKPEKFRRVK